MNRSCARCFDILLIALSAFAALAACSGGAGQFNPPSRPARQSFMQSSAPVAATLFAFTCNSSGACSNGKDPTSLILSGDGNFYGTTVTGGIGNKAAGTVFKITPAGQFSLIYTFVADKSGNYLDGANPSSLAEGNDGFLYGTADTGPTGAGGLVFKLSKTGTFQILNAAVGSFPYSLVRANDGDFFGCAGDGIGDTLFRVTPTGTYTLVHSFNSSSEGPGCIGLIAAANGNVYGTTIGAQTVFTTLFRVTPADQFTVLHTFHYSQFPTSVPTQANGGDLFGALSRTTAPQTQTAMFDIDLSGADYAEIDTPFPFNPPNLSYMTDGSDGNFWGIRGNAIASFTHGGTLLNEVTYSSQNGAAPLNLIQGTDGRFFGISGNDSTMNGSVFVVAAGLSAPKPLFVTFQPSAGTAGSPVAIHGLHFAGTKAVAFNGTRATFQVLNDDDIRVTVPAGATSGPISVTNNGGTTLSRTSFTVP
jgi:uncharacterized repeat protein (TIGR03803 family)